MPGDSPPPNPHEAAIFISVQTSTKHHLCFTTPHIPHISRVGAEIGFAWENSAELLGAVG